MARVPVYLGTVTITGGQTQSTIINADGNAGIRAAFGALIDVVIYCPATLPESVTVYLSSNDSATWTDMRQLKISGVAVTLGAGDCHQCPVGSFQAIGVQASAGVAADRTFTIHAQVEV